MKLPVPPPHLSPTAKRASLLGATMGMIAAGAAMGIALERRLIARALRQRENYTEALAALGSLRGAVAPVVSDDSVTLYTEVDEVADEGVTVVFCHGYGLHQDSWHFQRRELRRAKGVRKLVFYDQRGHGRSARGLRDHATIEQLGQDLGCVLTEAVPEGPVVLVGHSMGGMSIMALADGRPELFGDRVKGVALLSTSPGKLTEVTLGVPAALGRVAHRVVHPLFAALGRAPSIAERGRRLSSDVEHVLTRRYSFSSDVPDELVEWTAAMIRSTPVDVLAEIFPAFDAHDKLHALGVLQSVATLLLCGEYDLVTPADHTREMAEVLPEAELVVVSDAGHMVLAEHPEIVNAALRRLVARAGKSR